MKKELRVLLVDDDEDEYILLKSMMSGLPGQGEGVRYHLDWAPTYEDGLRFCSNNRFDVYLVDYHLGKYNGLELMRVMAEQGCGAPFILLTGQGSYALDLAAMQQGVYDYLLKDQINEYVLERSIRYAIERWQAQEELERRVKERTHELEERTVALAEANKSMRESELRFRALAETTSAAIFIVQDGRIRYANPAARFVTGYAPEALHGMELWRLLHPAYQKQLRDSRIVTHWSENIPARYELKIMNKRGDERWVDMTVGSMEFDGQPAWVFTAFDITERDLAEKDLRKARDELELRVAQRTAEIQATSQRLQAVLLALPVGIIIADINGQIIEGNSTFQALWDAPGPLPEDLRAWTGIEAWWTETGQPIRADDWPLLRSILHGESIIGKIIDIQTFTRLRRTIIYSSVPIFDPQGSIAGGVAVAQDITNQRLLEQQAQEAAREAQQRADELEGLHRATAALLSTLDLDELLCQILDAAQSAIPAAERGMLHLVSPGTGQLQVRATLGFSDERVCIIHSPKSPGYPAKVARERQPLLVPDTHDDGLPDSLAGLPAEMNDARSIILAPLYFGENVLGTLSLSATRPHAFDESNLRLLASFAATTTAALQNAILHAEIKQLAVTDPLTGQYNRRAFFDLGQRELDRFLRFNHPLSAVMVDLDHFKDVNDTYGHATGDQVLRSLAERCSANTRETDIFGRYGGDEFSILLPDTDLELAEHIAGRIRESVAGFTWMTERGPVLLSVSLGVAQATQRHRHLEDLLADADQALYKAKSLGRNRVEVITNIA